MVFQFLLQFFVAIIHSSGNYQSRENIERCCLGHKRWRSGITSG